MTIVEQTPTKLRIKANAQRNLLILGWVLLLVGFAIPATIRIRALQEGELRLPHIESIQQRAEARLRTGDFNGPPLEELIFRLAYEISTQILSGRRPIFPPAILGIIVGFLIISGPKRGQIFDFDTSSQQLSIKSSHRFFRSTTENYALDAISEVRVERDRYLNRSGDRNYGVSLILSHSEGVPLSDNYVHYKTVYPLSESHSYDSQSAKKIATQIEQML